MHDTVRGATKRVRSESSDAETNEPTALTAFTSDGFTLGSGGTANANNDTFVSWNWNAGSSTVTNTDGTISSQVRASQTAGISIVSWTGTGATGTIGHGLNSNPHLYIIKNRSLSLNWTVYTTAIDGSLDFGSLNTADAFSNSSLSAPTSSVFSVINANTVNQSGSNYIAYCISPVAGYSAVGSYTGTGSNSDGPFVPTGFSVAFVMFKRSDSTGDWIIFDNKRNTSDLDGNFIEKVLYPNKTTAEEDGANGDTMLFLSNGFKLNNVDYAYWNASGGTYIWVAFAENPFQANGGLAR